MVWMDRSLFEDESLIVCITFYFFLVFNFEFYFLQRYSYCTKVAPLCEIGATLLQCAIGCWQPFGNKFVTGSKRVLATLWQICNWASEVVGNPLTNFPKGICNFCKKYIFAIGLPTPSYPWPEGIAYPPEQLSEGNGYPL
jgi:hypothetical protein